MMWNLEGKNQMGAIFMACQFSLSIVGMRATLDVIFSGKTFCVFIAISSIGEK